MAEIHQTQPGVMSELRNRATQLGEDLIRNRIMVLWSEELGFFEHGQPTTGTMTVGSSVL